jgi:hypothetical protein
MKLLIDRLSYWLHRLPLAGRYGLPIITASNNNLLETSSYMIRIMESLGLCIPTSISCMVDVPRTLSSHHFRDVVMREKSRSVAEFLSESEMTVSAEQETYFQALKTIYRQVRAAKGSEVTHWIESGYAGFERFQDLQTEMLRRRIAEPVTDA